MTFVADRGDGGERLDQAVHRHLGGSHGLSRSAIQRRILDGGVLVNDALPRRPAVRLATGDVVTIDVERRRPAATPLADPRLAVEIVYEDDDALVVVKPAGVVAHPTAAQRQGTLVNALLAYGARAGRPWTPHLVQRLDRGTSGVVLVAKSGAAHAALQDALRAGEKDYLALVYGRLDPPQGTIDAPLGRDPLDRRRVVVRTSGAASATAYWTLARSSRERRGLSLIRCRLYTGRTHQIRVHLAERGCPIVGDSTYGRPPRARLASPALDRLARGFARPALHAWRLSFRALSDDRVVTCEASIPDDLLQLLDAAGLAERLRSLAGAPPPSR